MQICLSPFHSGCICVSSCRNFNWTHLFYIINNNNIKQIISMSFITEFSFSLFYQAIFQDLRSHGSLVSKVMMHFYPQDIADPFFAYCKQHADRFDRKWKRKNYLALQSYCKVSLQEREKQLSPEAQVRFTLMQTLSSIHQIGCWMISHHLFLNACGFPISRLE